MMHPHCRNVVHMFATAEGLLTQQDLLNLDGLQEVFATNLFGHFLLVRPRLHLQMASDKSVVKQPTCGVYSRMHSFSIVYNSSMV